MEDEYVIKEIVKFGVPFDTAICRALINGYCKEMDINRAESLLGFFAREFQIFDIESYNALVVTRIGKQVNKDCKTSRTILNHKLHLSQ